MREVLLIEQFRFNHFVLKKLIDGIGDEDAGRDPGPEGNTVAWSLRHILANRGDLVMRLLESKQRPEWAEVEEEKYALMGVALEASQEDLETALRRAASRLGEELERPIPSGGETLAAWVGSSALHEAYHAGQIGMARRMIGLGKGITGD